MTRHVFAQRGRLLAWVHFVERPEENAGKASPKAKKCFPRGLLAIMWVTVDSDDYYSSKLVVFFKPRENYYCTATPPGRPTPDAGSMSTQKSPPLSAFSRPWGAK